MRGKKRALAEALICDKRPVYSEKKETNTFSLRCVVPRRKASVPGKKNT